MFKLNSDVLLIVLTLLLLVLPTLDLLRLPWSEALG